VTEGRLARLRRTLNLLAPIAREGLDQLLTGWRGQALTLIGIVWGAAAVVLLLSLGAGFREFLDLRFEKTGPRWLEADNGYTSAERDGRRPGRRISFTTDDLERLRSGLSSASLVAGEGDAWVSAETPFRTRPTAVSAASAELRLIRNHQVARGRYFDVGDERRRHRVAVIGAELPEIFFGGGDPLGRRIELDGEPYQVIGVLARKGRQLITFDDLDDNMIFIPLEVGLRTLGRGKEIGHFFLEPRRLADEVALRAETRAALRPLHHLAADDAEAITFLSVPEIARPTRNIFVALQVLLGAVGTVTLAMAGMGLANLMIAIANERRSEFAVRRTTGARRGDLVLQLVVETAVVVLAGGAVGVLLGLSIVWGLNALPLPAEVPPPRLLPSAVVTTFLVLVGVGLAAGILPGRTASRVDPGAALRVL
jgi:putative ABC transport system permease protein